MCLDKRSGGLGVKDLKSSIRCFFLSGVGALPFRLKRGAMWNEVIRGKSRE